MSFSLFRGRKSPPKMKMKPSLNETYGLFSDSWGKKIGVSAAQTIVGVGLPLAGATYAIGIGVNKLGQALGLSRPTPSETLDAETKAMKGNFDEQMREQDILNTRARDPNYMPFRNVLQPYNQLLTGGSEVKDNSGKADSAMSMTNAAVVLGVLALAGIALLTFKKGKP